MDIKSYSGLASPYGSTLAWTVGTRVKCSALSALSEALAQARGHDNPELSNPGLVPTCHCIQNIKQQLPTERTYHARNSMCHVHRALFRVLPYVADESLFVNELVTSQMTLLNLPLSILDDEVCLARRRIASHARHERIT